MHFFLGALRVNNTLTLYIHVVTTFAYIALRSVSRIFRRVQYLDHGLVWNVTL